MKSRIGGPLMYFKNLANMKHILILSWLHDAEQSNIEVNEDPNGLKDSL